jgi:hypothetical protein
MLLLMLLCKILVGAPRQRYWLPLIFLVWVNVHGGWLVGLGILWLWSLVEAVGPVNERPALSLAVGVPIACTLVTLCNPYGWHLWQFLASTVRLSRANIDEWQPIWRESLGWVVLWVAGVVWVVMAVLVAEKRAAKTIAVVAMLAFAALCVNRLLPLFVPAAVILTPICFRRVRSEATDLAQGAAPRRCGVCVHRPLRPSMATLLGGMHSHARHLAA